MRSRANSELPAATADCAGGKWDSNSSPRTRDRAFGLGTNGIQAVLRLATIIVHRSTGVILRLVVLSRRKCQADCSNQTVIDSSMASVVRENHHRESATNDKEVQS